MMAQTDGPKRITDDSDKVQEQEIPEFEEVTVVSAIKDFNDEDEGEEFEYVVESLEVDEDEEEDEDGNPRVIEVAHDVEIEDVEESPPKKIKLENYPKRDALAEAMAHVHADYIDGHDDHHVTIGLDMEVESETTILPDTMEETEDKTQEIEDCEAESPQKPNLVAYKLNNSTVHIATNNNNTLTLNPGKTVTLNTTKGQSGTQYVLSKVKGSLPNLVMAGSKTTNHRTIAPKGGSKGKGNTMLVLAGTSNSSASTSANTQESDKEPERIVMKHPCISTHVLDTSKGIPVSGLQVSLYKLMDGRWTFLNER